MNKKSDNFKLFFFGYLQELLLGTANIVEWNFSIKVLIILNVRLA